MKVFLVLLVIVSMIPLTLFAVASRPSSLPPEARVTAGSVSLLDADSQEAASRMYREDDPTLGDGGYCASRTCTLGCTNGSCSASCPEGFEAVCFCSKRDGSCGATCVKC